MRGGLADATVVLTALLACHAALAQTSPYVDPPFASQCVVHHFEENQQPPLDGCGEDPFCVEFEKRDITGSNGGAIRFLADEPSRFAAAIPKCRYWQQDHWRVQPNPGDPTIVQWDGSYWFNKGNGTGAARLRNFTIAGNPASPAQAAALIAPFDPELAAVILQYGEGEGGGGGSSFELGASDPSCAAPPGGSTCYDSVDFSRAQAAARVQCDCASTVHNARYRRCVSDVATAQNLPAECVAILVHCAKRSTCGRAPGSIICFRTSFRGVTKCRPRRNPGACRAPENGTARVGTGTSCCDPPTVDGCP
jgi:hypothetical protein